MTLFILKEYLKENSKYKLFLEFLPEDLSSSPLFFSKENLELIKGSFVSEKIKIWEIQLLDEYNKLKEKNINNLFSIKEFSLEEYKKFRYLVWSRNFNMPRDGKMYSTMVPVTELCNFHPRKINTDWDYFDDKKSFIVKAERKILKGEEVFIINLT